MSPRAFQRCAKCLQIRSGSLFYDGLKVNMWECENCSMSELASFTKAYFISWDVRKTYWYFTGNSKMTTVSAEIKQKLTFLFIWLLFRPSSRRKNKLPDRYRFRRHLAHRWKALGKISKMEWARIANSFKKQWTLRVKGRNTDEHLEKSAFSQKHCL